MLDRRAHLVQGIDNDSARRGRHRGRKGDDDEPRHDECESPRPRCDTVLTRARCGHIPTELASRTNVDRHEAEGKWIAIDRSLKPF